MAYQPYTVEGFGGLNLRDDPAQVGAGAAIDALNVLVDGTGVLRPRPGYAAFSDALSSFGTSGCVIAHRRSRLADRAPFFMVAAQSGTAAKTWLVDESGTTTPSATLASASGWLMVGTPFNYEIYTEIATASGVLRVTTGGSSATDFSVAPAVTSVDGVPRYIGRTGLSGRLVQANFADAADSPTGSDGSTSTVFFSRPNNALSYGADDWVDVGETINGLVLWNDVLFVFGSRSLFVFYGESVDSTGGVIFNYRPVAMSVGTIQPGTLGQAACAGPDGVYFATSQGIWRTTGAGPTLVSGLVDPAFIGDFYGASTTDPSLIANMTSAGRYICVSYGENSNAAGRTLMYDTQTGQWSTWQIGKGSAPIARSASTRGDELYYVDTGAAKVMRFDPDLGTDNGSAMSWRYQSGWYDMGHPQEKFAGRSWLFGTGSPTLSLFTDYGSTDAQASAVTLGTSPTIARGEHLPVYQGRLFSHKLSGTAQATVSQLGHNLIGMRNR